MSNKGNLLSVHSGVEEAYVLTLLIKSGIESQMIWIGLSDKYVYTYSHIIQLNNCMKKYFSKHFSFVRKIN